MYNDIWALLLHRKRCGQREVWSREVWSKGGVVKRCGCKRGVVKSFPPPPPTLELWAHQEMVDGSPGHMLTVKYVQPFQGPAPPRDDITRVVM